MHTKHVVYIRTLLPALQAGIQNTNPGINSLLRKNLGSFMQVSAVAMDGIYKTLLL